MFVLVAALGGAVAAQEAPLAESLGTGLPLVAVFPFALILLSIATFPLFAPHWWEHNRNKAIVAALLAAPVAIYLLTVWGPEGREVLDEKILEYVSFIVLLAALFVISGGIYLQGSFAGTPLVNTVFIGLGAVLANLIGTTGASVLLIRPLLRANRSRQRKVHVIIFFIFVVANCAGLLTPLGDPPLFLGFLKGVPFEWTLRLWPQWLMVNAILLVVFNVWDQIVLDREEKERPGSQLEEVMRHEPFRIHGAHNFIFLVGIMLTVLAAGKGLGTGGGEWPYGIKEGMMALLAIAAYVATRAEYREKNSFTFGPIVEVAVLFAGIFVTMAPALVILNAWGQGQREVWGVAFGLSNSWHFFWSTGALSSFLDNAPTYLTFSATAAGLEGVPVGGRFLATFLEKGPEAVRLLTAISCGAVFMGANTYIGNGPNFMVKAIAEENGIKMPGFFGYMLYSGAVL
ncbi:MAG: sodium:proton antiporter, partial [Gemmatimonadales bacterium]|nr:sodium:proton antiporter [Gemmatimonadales bacterium]